MRKCLLFIFIALSCHVAIAQEVLLSTLNQLYSFNVTNCTFQLVANLEIQVYDIAYAPDGDLYGITGTGNLFLIDQTDGSIDIIHSFSGQIFNSLTVSADSKVYATGLNGQLWYYDLNSQQETYVGDVGFGATGDLTFNDGKLYVAVGGDDIVEINLDSPGNSQVVINESVDGSVWGIFSFATSCSEISSYVATNNNSDIYEVDFENGSFNFICQLPFQVTGGASEFEFLGSDPVYIDDITISIPDCNSNDGQILIEASGGLGTLFYSLNGSSEQVSNEFNNLSSGIYNVVVVDENGCSIDEEINLVGTTTPIIIDVIVVDPFCNNGTGSIVVIAEGGTGSIQYSIDGNVYQDSNTFLDLLAGTYRVTIIDEEGCEADEEVVLTLDVPPAIQDVIIQQPSCGVSDGIIEIIATGTQLMYSIDGINFQNSNVFSGLNSGVLEVFVIDNNSCLESIIIIIENQGDVPIIDNIIVSNATCGLNNGAILVEASGGLGNLEYSIDNITFQLSPNFDNITPGNITVFVRDELNCIITYETVISSGIAPEIIILNQIDIDCINSFGSILIEVINGSEPYDYSINNVSQQTGEFINLENGSYQILVEDSNGCTATSFVEIDSIVTIEIENFVKFNTSCGLDNGIIEISTSSNNFNCILNNEDQGNTTVFNNLKPMFYELIVVDENNCSDSIELTIEETLPFVIDSISITHNTCGLNNGEIEILHSNSDFEIAINNNEYSSEQIYQDLAHGEYVISAVSMEGCYFRDTIQINDSDSISVEIIVRSTSSCNEDIGSVEINSLNSIDNLIYTLNDANVIPEGSIISNLSFGNYELYIQDENQCNTTKYFTILQGDCEVHIPNIFSPNSDGQNDEFQLYISPNFRGSLDKFDIYDRWGNLVFQGSDIHSSWNGKFKGQLATVGVYVYHIVLSNEDLSKSVLTGDVTLIR